MSEDAIDSFLKVDTRERLRRIQDPRLEAKLRAYLGARVFEEYQGLATRASEHLGERPPNLIFIPGSMGSLLLSQSLGGIWWIDARTLQHLDDLRLSPDGLSDANPGHKISPCATDTIYEPFLTALLESDDFAHVGFPYDWRKPLSASAQALRDRIMELYVSSGGDAVHLVAHSMGGLLVRTTLMKYGNELWDKVGRIVFLATPHYGSPMIGGYLKNHLWGFDLMALLGHYLGRETYRSLWGVLSLLPAPRGIYPGTRPTDQPQWNSGELDDTYAHPCCNFDLYRAEEWKLSLTSAETVQLQTALNSAADFHQKLYQAHLSLSQDLKDRMLVIAGVGYKTLFRLGYVNRLLGLWEHMDKVTSRIPGDPHRDGDGRVAVTSASLEGVTIRYVKGIHTGLPNIPSVYQEVFRWLQSKRLELDDSVEGALSLHLGPENVSVAPNLDGTARGSTTEEDPGYLSFEAPSPEQIQLLKNRLSAGELPEFINTRLL
ncbi:MAG TPA: alpha/beta fold hydrolase [Thermoanaerobaculia bacterium]|nr:alpha/beta fold hydrolase [Thermoanaerobaculia bacterium]